jgi:hypothetical protein
MRWLSLPLLAVLCACEPPRPAVYAKYQPSEVASESWCRLGEGAYAFVPRPQVAPSLVSSDCIAPRRDPPPVMMRPASTFAELVVEPGASIEIPVQLPKVLRATGCQLDSVLIPHGKRTSDVAIEIADAGRVVPIVSYEQRPPPREEGVVQRTVVDGSGARRAFRAADTARNALEVIADPELWPTGATLRFDGGRAADGAATVVFEIELEPEPQPEPAAAEEPATDSPSPSDASPPSAPWGAPLPSTPPVGSKPPPFGPSPDAPPPSTPLVGNKPPPLRPSPDASPPDAPAPSEGTDTPSTDDSDAAPPMRTPSLLELVAYRHQIDIAAPAAFSIVLRARTQPFGIGVRSDRESPDPRLSYRAPGATELTPTHLVPQVVIVVSRCGRPLVDVVRDIR